MKLLFVIHSMQGGGAERVTATLANHWEESGWEVTVVTLASVGQDFYELRPGVRRISLDLEGESGNPLSGLIQNLRRVMGLRKFLRCSAPDVALGIMTNANILLALAAFGLRVRTVGSERVHPPAYQLGPIWSWLRRNMYGRLSVVAALTSHTASWLTTHTNARQVHVIPNAAQWPLPIQRPVVHPESVVSCDKKVLLAVGRLEVQKGFDLLLEAFVELVKSYPDWVLVILGEGRQRTEISCQIRKLGLSDCVLLPGQIGNVGDWYERAELYALTSRFEGFPNTLAEAMASSLPVVSFDCETGPKDIVRHEIDGLLVPPGDVAQLRVALNRLMGDADLRARFAERAVDARDRFSIERVAGMWEKLFGVKI